MIDCECLKKKPRKIPPIKWSVGELLKKKKKRKTTEYTNENMRACDEFLVELRTERHLNTRRGTDNDFTDVSIFVIVRDSNMIIRTRVHAKVEKSQNNQ